MTTSLRAGRARGKGKGSDLAHWLVEAHAATLLIGPERDGRRCNSRVAWWLLLCPRGKGHDAGDWDPFSWLFFDGAAFLFRHTNAENTGDMNSQPTALERAFELARSGDCPDLPALRRRLQAEGYGRRLIEGPALIRQLNDLCKTSVTPSGSVQT